LSVCYLIDFSGADARKQVEEYKGARDLNSLKEYVVMMKTKVSLDVDFGSEHVPDYKTHEEDDDDEEEEEDVEDEEDQVKV